MEASNVITRPIITEKSMREASLGHFSFEVDIHARKQDVKKAIETNFNVDVEAIKTLIVKGRHKRAGKRRRPVELGPWKKAIVTLAPNQKIDLFEVVENGKKT